MSGAVHPFVMTNAFGTPFVRPTFAAIFNDRKGPELLRESVSREHAYCQFETWQTTDESGRPSHVLAVWSETATADEIWSWCGRLPDYIQARKFPPSLVEQLAAGSPSPAAAQPEVSWPAPATPAKPPASDASRSTSSLVDYVEGS